MTRFLLTISKSDASILALVLALGFLLQILYYAMQNQPHRLYNFLFLYENAMHARSVCMTCFINFSKSKLSRLKCSSIISFLSLAKNSEILQHQSRHAKEQFLCWTLSLNLSISCSNSCYNTKHNFSLKFSFPKSGS